MYKQRNTDIFEVTFYSEAARSVFNNSINDITKKIKDFFSNFQIGSNMHLLLDTVRERVNDLLLYFIFILSSSESAFYKFINNYKLNNSCKNYKYSILYIV